MLLSATVSCAAALRWFVVLQPVMAGLGIYGFLRSEGTGRPAATVGGLALAMMIAGSSVGVSLPFAGSLAWSAVLLFCASRFVRSPTWPRRLLWLGAAAVSWGQVASAHLSDGLVIGTAALAAYLIGALVGEVRGGRMPARRALGLAGLLVAAVPLVNLGVLLPRLSSLSHTTIGLGYGELARRAAAFRDRAPRIGIGPASGAGWPLQLAGPVGAFAGMVPMALALAGWKPRRSRAVWIAIAAFGAVCYLLSLDAVAKALAHVMLSQDSTLGNYYLHEPARLRIGALLAVAAMAGFGVEAWRRSASWKERAVLVAPGIALWWVAAPAIGAANRAWVLALLGAVAGGVVLVAAVRRPALLFVLPLVVAVELVASGLVGQSERYSLHGSIEVPADWPGFPPLREPGVRVADYASPDDVTRALRATGGSRYLTIPPTTGDAKRGTLSLQRPADWPLMANQRSVLFRLEDVDGVNPVQSIRYWTFLRATDRRLVQYNAAFYRNPPPLALDLFAVGAVVVRGSGCDVLSGPATAAVTAGGITVCRIDDPAPRAELVSGWREVSSAEQALREATADGFDPGSEAIVEADPGLGASGPPGSAPATYEPTGAQSARVTVDAPRPGILVVRNAYDDDWHATVDGRPAPVLAVDSLVQGVAVPAGRHVVVLGYDDPSIGLGLLGSALSLLTLGAAAGWLAARAHRKRRAAPA
jgi:hypothetical protein